MGSAPTIRVSMLYDKARIFVQAGRGGDGCMSLPPRGARAARRPRRRRRRARRRGRARVRRLAARPAVVQAPRALQGRPRRATARARSATAPTAATLRGPRAAGDAVATLEDGTVPRPRRARASAPWSPRGGSGGRGNQPLRVRRPASRRASPSAGLPGERGLDRAAAEAAGRRRARGPAERRQVVAAVAHDARGAEDRRATRSRRSSRCSARSRARSAS